LTSPLPSLIVSKMWRRIMRQFVVIGVLSILIGCAPQTGVLLYKPGVNLATKQSDLDDCRIVSMKEVPQNLQTSVSPGFSNPGTVMCNSYGTFTSCNTVGAYNIPPTVTTVDANSGLRSRILNRCLNAKGYQLYERPYCTTKEQISYIASHQNEVPACAIRSLQ